MWSFIKIAAMVFENWGGQVHGRRKRKKNFRNHTQVWATLLINQPGCSEASSYRPNQLIDLNFSYNFPKISIYSNDSHFVRSAREFDAVPRGYHQKITIFCPNIQHDCWQNGQIWCFTPYVLFILTAAMLFDVRQ